MLDPERPIDPDTVVADLVPREEARSGVRARLIGVALVVVALTTAAVAWRYTPLREWMEPSLLLEFSLSIREDPLAPLFAILAFVGGGLVLFPVMVLVGVTAIVFGPLLGTVYALIGATMSGALTFAIGRHLSRENVRKLAGRRLNDLSRRLGERGLLAIIFARVVPVGPFSIVNIVAGASHIRWRDFLIGTVIGLLPGVLVASIFVDRVASAIDKPGTHTYAPLVAVGAALVVLVFLIGRKLRARAEARRDQVPSVHGS